MKLPQLVLGIAGAGSTLAAECTEFGSSLAIPDVKVNFAQFVPAGSNLTFSKEGDLATCIDTSQVVSADMCRVAMYVATSNRSGITLEAWLPMNWTGRFLSTGNGGLGGCIPYSDLAYGAGLGFATVGANNGHNGSTGTAFLNNDDVIHDFASRSMHTSVVVGKQVTANYYSEPHTKSYYLGCSTGGRQGFKMVQSYPTDFDGVVAGAPAFAFNSLLSWSATFFTYFGSPGSATFIPPGDAWVAIHNEVLRQCDALDGVTDGILEDPSQCAFDTSILLCGSNVTETCFTAPQVSALNKTFSDFSAADGSVIYPRMQPGSELIAQFTMYTSGPFPYSEDWFRHVVYNDTNWNASTFTVADAQAAIDLDPFQIETWEGDLSPFEENGGKLLHYHGLSDMLISSENSPRYYEHVATTMDRANLDTFYRYFRVSGMYHCGGGIGAHQIGQGLKETSVMNPQNNVLLRMVDWVENGNAPETITGTKYINDTQANGVDFIRDHCKYPLRNVCKDPANYKLPTSWTCV